MSHAIVHSSDPITLVGGGEGTSEDIAEALTLAPTIVAVDGGLSRALAAGMMPDAVIGDMDSVPPEALARMPQDRQHLFSEQQTTDFDKALRHIETPLAIGVGFCGGRIDHQLAAYHTLLAHPDRPCILIAGTQIAVLAPPAVTLSLPEGAAVSLFPLVHCTGRSTGLDWPIDGLAFAPGEFIGTSNRATGGAVTVTMDGPGMVLILGRAYLRQVVACFLQGGARWPARAR
ncbi:thiamine diphosphokinase [Sulfitobacter sp. HNIBRBA3233]|uniref:thiamine diphosphokinase n=1 Tax=Sulfitobacter marinivivus TaxID=3158558 RepID=UPI0032E003DD